jgi:hypothetical protein
MGVRSSPSIGRIPDDGFVGFKAQDRMLGEVLSRLLELGQSGHYTGGGQSRNGLEFGGS